MAITNRKEGSKMNIICTCPDCLAGESDHSQYNIPLDEEHIKYFTSQKLIDTIDLITSELYRRKVIIEGRKDLK